MGMRMFLRRKFCVTRMCFLKGTMPVDCNMDKLSSEDKNGINIIVFSGNKCAHVTEFNMEMKPPNKNPSHSG